MDRISSRACSFFCIRLTGSLTQVCLRNAGRVLLQGEGGGGGGGAAGAGGSGAAGAATTVRKEPTPGMLPALC